MHRIPFLSAITLLTACLMLIATAGADAPATQPTGDQQQMESWWQDLEKPEPAASRALLHFAAMPIQTTAFLKDHLPPLKISDDDLNKLLADLGSDDESVWKPAFEKLEYFDPRLNKDLPTLMSDITDPPARTRLVEILCDHPADSLAGKNINLSPVGNSGEFNFFDGHGSWWAEAKVSNLSKGGWSDSGKKKWTRAIRAIVLLENIGTPDAMAIVKAMATGNEGAAPTKVAKEVLGIPVSEEK